MSKYVVFKAKDFDNAVKAGHEFASELAKDLDDLSIDDAWVIRSKDSHAPATAYAYANAVQSTIEILENIDSVSTDKAIVDLTQIRDAAFAYAENARYTVHQLPD